MSTSAVGAPNLAILIVRLNEQWDPLDMNWVNYVFMWKKIEASDKGKVQDFTARPLQSIFQIGFILQKLEAKFNPIDLEAKLHDKGRYSANLSVSEGAMNDFLAEG
jgi:hypothetical protein